MVNAGLLWVCGAHAGNDGETPLLVKRATFTHMILNLGFYQTQERYSDADSHPLRLRLHCLHGISSPVSLTQARSTLPRQALTLSRGMHRSRMCSLPQSRANRCTGNSYFSRCSKARR